MPEDDELKTSRGEVTVHFAGRAMGVASVMQGGLEWLKGMLRRVGHGRRGRFSENVFQRREGKSTSGCSSATVVNDVISTVERWSQWVALRSSGRKVVRLVDS